jgi:hypothetical protein
LIIRAKGLQISIRNTVARELLEASTEDVKEAVAKYRDENKQELLDEYERNIRDVEDDGDEVVENEVVVEDELERKRRLESRAQ